MASRSSSQLERARLLRARGLSRRQVAEQLGVSVTTLARWLDPSYASRERERSREAKRRRRRPCGRCAAPLSYDRSGGLCRSCQHQDALARHEQVARLYQSGLQFGQVAQRTGLSEGHVRAVLARLAIAGRVTARHVPCDRAAVAARDHLVLALRRRGMPRAEVARRVGLNVGSLSTVLARHRREPHGPPALRTVQSPAPPAHRSQ